MCRQTRAKSSKSRYSIHSSPDYLALAGSDAPGRVVVVGAVSAGLIGWLPEVVFEKSHVPVQLSPLNFLQDTPDLFWTVVQPPLPEHVHDHVPDELELSKAPALPLAIEITVTIAKYVRDFHIARLLQPFFNVL